jgi:hypothetical protein
MGDPSVMTYLTKPSIMTVEIPTKTHVGDETFTAKVAPYSYCALTDSNKELVSAGFADAAGNITLTFAPIIAPTTYEFSAWAQKYIQYFKTINIDYVGITQYEKEMECTVYPNPTTGELHVTLSRCHAVTSVEIFDVYGRNILSHTAHRTPHTVLDISHLQAGIYFLKITTENETITKKVVKY